MNISTATAIAMLVSVTSMSSAIAIPANASETHDLLISQTTSVNEISGEVTSVSGETVQVEQPNGQMSEITIPQQEIDRLDIRPGAQVTVNVDDRNVATSVRVTSRIRALW